MDDVKCYLSSYHATMTVWSCTYWFWCSTNWDKAVYCGWISQQ